MQVAYLLAGLMLLFLGRKLFWLFVGVAGFLAGAQFAADVLAPGSALMILLAGAAVGMAGAFLAIVLERVAFAVAGFYVCFYLAMTFFREPGEPYHHALLVGAGMLGAVFAFLVMDWGIIFLSSIMGAGLIVSVLHIGPTGDVLLYLVLVFTGFAVQSQLMEQARRPVDAR